MKIKEKRFLANNVYKLANNFMINSIRWTENASVHCFHPKRENFAQKRLQLTATPCVNL